MLPTTRAPLGAALVAGLALVAGSWAAVARVATHQCLGVDGVLGTVGLRLMLLRPAADCPDGTLAVAPGVGHGAMLAFGLALPVLAAHAALGALGLGLATVVARAVRGALRVLRSVLPVLPDRSRVHPWARVTLPVDGCRPALPTGVPVLRHPLRGPPPAFA